MGSRLTSIQCVLWKIQLDQGRQATYSLSQLARIDPVAAADICCMHCRQQNPQRIHLQIRRLLANTGAC